MSSRFRAVAYVCSLEVFVLAGWQSAYGALNAGVHANIILTLRYYAL